MTAATVESTALPHRVVEHDQWIAERKAFLAREKELTRLQDQLARDRRALPWERVEKAYVFDTPQGPRTLADLFDGHGQLMVQHFMLGPGWEAGCPSCSFMSDHVDGALPHLHQRDLRFVAVSRAPLAEIERFRQRMGWRFDWVSSFGTDFNQDYGVSFSPEETARGAVNYNYRMQPGPAEAPGISLFRRDGAGNVFHTYSTYGRGVEAMMGTYVLLDLAPKGRDEDALPYTMAWVRHHDRYDTAAATPAAACCRAQH